MPRPSTKPRVPDLDPEAEALAFARRVLEHLADAVRALLAPARQLPKRTSADELRTTAVYECAYTLAAFAVHGEPLRHSVRETMEPLAPLATALLWPRVELESIASNIDPNYETDPMKLLIAAALAREQLQGQSSVTTSQLAILAGLTRRHLGLLARTGEIEIETAGKPGTGGAYLVKSSAARKWLASRGVSGFPL